MPWAGLRLAITLLTAVPLPGSRSAGPASPPRRAVAAALYWAPFAGLALGAVAAGILLLATRYGHTGSLLAAVLAVAALAGLTRGLHLDGLADTADGLGSRRPASAALEIMKKSDIGPFGVVTLLLVLLIQVSALAQAGAAGRGPVAVIAASVAARLAIMCACCRGIPPARPDGLGAMVARTVHPAFAGILILAALAGAAALGWIYAVAIAISLAASAVLTVLAVRRLGGITGDVLGAAAEVAAAACLLVTAIR
jgi:adenosylcobinamide-GDP ribazoletransferase